MRSSNLKNASRQFLYLFLMVMLHFTVQAQTSVSGIIKDANGEPLPFANVLLLDASDSSLVTGNTSNLDGDFILENLEPGQFLLKLSMIGFEDVLTETFSLIASEETKNFPDFIMHENSVQLAEVQLVAKKPLFEQKIDRMVVNVENSITSAGSTALEVLKRSPGIMINPQTNAISMNGKAGVVVMINGKITRMPMDAVIQMLEGMSSDNIRSIELIHTPPADFDAGSNAGFINIVMKKNLDEGFNGGYTMKAGHGKEEKAGGAINFNLRNNNFNLYGDYSINYNNNPQLFTQYRSFTYENVFYENDISSVRNPTYLTVQNARLGIDIEAGEKTVIGGLFSWFDRKWDMDAINDSKQLEDGVQVSRIYMPNEEQNHSYNYLGNLNINHKLSETQTLNLDLDYTYYFNDNPSLYNLTFFDSLNLITDAYDIRATKMTPMDILVGKFDYISKPNDKTTIETGLKATAISFNNDNIVEENHGTNWELAPLFSSITEMSENIYAAYSAYSYQLSQKTDVKIGLRYEFTDANLGSEAMPNIVDNQYGNLFPSIFINSKLKENNSLQFSYRRSIQRPSFRQLAPWFIFVDPTTILTGNPELQPSISNDFRANMSIKTFQIALQYTYSSDPIGRFQPEIDFEENIQINGAKNFVDSHLGSATLSFPININNNWDIRTSWTSMVVRFNDLVDGEKLVYDQFSWYMNGSINYQLPKDFSLELAGRYSSAARNGAVSWQSTNNVDFGIQKKFRDNGSLKFSVNDIFVGANFLGIIDDPDLDYSYRGYYGFAEREFRLTYTNTFGNAKVKAARNRQTGSVEEQRRAN